MESTESIQPHCLLRIAPERFSRLLAWIVAALVLTHLLLQGIHYRIHELPWLFTELFDVDVEESFPTWFSSFMLFVASVLLLAIATRARECHGRFVAHWYGLALGFAILSMDEVVGLHETLNTVTDFSWTIPGAVVVLVALLFYVRFVGHLPSRTRWLFLIAGAIYVGGCIGVEHVGDYYDDAYGRRGLGYEWLTALEEGLEMIGVVVFIRVLLDYLLLRDRLVVPVVGVVVQRADSSCS